MKNLSDEDIAKLQAYTKEAEKNGLQKALNDSVNFSKRWRKYLGVDEKSND